MLSLIDCERFKCLKYIKVMLTQTNVVPINLSPSEVVLQTFEVSNVDEYVLLFAENARFQVANYPVAYGEKGIRESMEPILEVAKSIKHSVELMWETEDTVVCKGEVYYERFDGKFVPPIPVGNVFRVKGNKITELIAFGDFSPLFQ